MPLTLRAGAALATSALRRSRSRRRRRRARRGRRSSPRRFVQTLANGLRVIVVQRDGLPLVTAELVFVRAAEADPARVSGLADLTATLLTKGTARRTAPQIAEAAEALGGSTGAAAPAGIVRSCR